MIGRLSGRVVEDGADGMLVLDVRGVGYEVTAPLGALGRAPVDANGEITLFVHTHVREDALSLYGFPTREDRVAFRALIGVSNVGPKIAVSLLGAMSAGELAAAIARGDVARLTKIPGVGKRTAERLVLELKDKLPASQAALPAPIAPARPGGKSETLQGALTNLGFRPAEAERAVAALGDRVDAEPMGELVRAALALLAR